MSKNWCHQHVSEVDEERAHQQQQLFSLDKHDDISGEDENESEDHVGGDSIPDEHEDEILEEEELDDHGHDDDDDGNKLLKNLFIWPCKQIKL